MKRNPPKKVGIRASWGLSLRANRDPRVLFCRGSAAWRGPRACAAPPGRLSGALGEEDQYNDKEEEVRWYDPQGGGPGTSHMGFSPKSGDFRTP